MTQLKETIDPNGELTLQVVAMPRDTNGFGDIYSGWLLSQMDLAGMVMARKISRGRVATVAVGSMGFIRPVPVGSVVRCYASLTDTGRTSMHITVEVWIDHEELEEPAKVSEGEFWYVAINDQGKTRQLPN